PEPTARPGVREAPGCLSCTRSGSERSSPAKRFSMPNTLLHPLWRPRALLICHLIALLLLASWLWQPTRQLWDAFDLWLFHLLNDPVHATGLWARIWAIGSMRPV